MVKIRTSFARQSARISAVWPPLGILNGEAFPGRQHAKLFRSNPCGVTGFRKCLGRSFARFVGQEAFVKLRMSPDGQPRGRRQFQGILQRLEDGDGGDALPERMGLIVDGKEGTPELLEFSFDEVEKARLVPRIEFRSRAEGKKR